MTHSELETQVSLEEIEAAFYALKPALDAMSKPPSRITLDIGESIKAGFWLQRAVEQPEVKTSLDRLDPLHLDPVHRSQLALASPALLYVKTHLQTVQALHPRATLPKTMVVEAKGIAFRQKSLLGYYVDAPQDLVEFKAIRKGTSHKDRAYDLIRLNRLIEAHRDVISQDTRHFREEDLKRGPQLAVEMLKRLGNPQPHEWKTYAKRLFELFRTSYNEVQVAATFAMRHTAFANDFPTLHKVARRTPSKKKKNDNTPETKTAQTEAKSDGTGKADKGKKKTNTKNQTPQAKPMKASNEDQPGNKKASTDGKPAQKAAEAKPDEADATQPSPPALPPAVGDSPQDA